MKNSNYFKIIYGIVVLILGLILVNCKKDETSPVLSINGNTEIKIILNDTAYSLPTASASDETDGDISANIEINDSVNVNLTGLYIVSYKVKDAAGNEATAELNVTVYNQAEKYEGIYTGRNQYPYPGTEPVLFQDNILASTKKNNEIIFENFASVKGSNVTASIMQGTVYGTQLVFKDKDPFLFDFEEDDKVSTISSYQFQIIYLMAKDSIVQEGRMSITKL